MKKPINKCKDKSFVKIPGVSGYLVNKKGGIFSEFKGEVMKPALRSGYYFVVIMTDDGKRVNKMIHRLMAETFLPNPDNLPEIDHIDGNALNNNLDNLRWVTKKENQNNPISREGRYKAIRKRQGIPIKAFYNGKSVGNFTCLMEAARKFSLHCTMISKQLRGKIDNVNGYTFERL
nr:MAG: zinc-binding loop region of homing endonuclease [Bacteriophage sp.]